MNKGIRNIKISLLPEKLSIILFCCFNACKDFFVSLIKQEEKNIKKNNIIQKIKYKFANKLKYYADKYFNKSKCFLQNNNFVFSVVVHNKHCFT
ncbi:MAG: hypothetical protein LBV69_07625 [Bacteroidales bacterium]|jgi:hypothetical protein|nr:hypothetical protein [Bacteroidales bacterium]